jgi:hypothetical protein
MPGSPLTRTSEPWPDRASSSAETSWANSGARPTNGRTLAVPTLGRTSGGPGVDGPPTSSSVSSSLVAEVQG